MTVDEIQAKIDQGQTVFFKTPQPNSYYRVKPLGFTIDEERNVLVKGEEVRFGTISYWDINLVFDPDDFVSA